MSILGGLLSLGGGLLGSERHAESAEDQRTLQREFAQQGIQWRVADAKAAGLHPLFALGGNIPQPAGIAIGEDPLGRAISDMGQDMTRAARSQMTPEQRVFQTAQLEELRSRTAQNTALAQLYDAQRSRLMAPGTPPGVPSGAYVNPPSEMPSVGFGDVASVVMEPSRVTHWSPGDRGIEAGLGTGGQVHAIGEGLPGSDFKFWVPKGSLSEMLESMGESLFASDFILGENMRRNPNFWSDYAPHSATAQFVAKGRAALADQIEALANEIGRMRFMADVRRADSEMDARRAEFRLRPSQRELRAPRRWQGSWSIYNTR